MSWNDIFITSFLGRDLAVRVAALRLTPLAIIAKNPFYILNYKFFYPFAFLPLMR